MSCASCSSSSNGTPRGCGSKGHCSSGGCNKLNTYDWLSKRDIPLVGDSQIVEVSFKNGARKDFFHMDRSVDAITGDMVVVNSGAGYDVGRICLSGDLVFLQMKKKKVKEEWVKHNVVRIANDRDLEKLETARGKEHQAMVQSRVIARNLGLEMKIGDVEYQGDLRKATFYYTADGRVDFRELVRAYAKEFRVKIEMRQIGIRQESARIGGIGSCGRELCCSTWLTDFKSVSTSAARYQYMAINQSKLSGQCGRLKCCLNYELDTYMDALSQFPVKADVLKLKDGKANLIKIDIFKGLMYYGITTNQGRGPVVTLDKENVKDVLAMNRRKEYPETLASFISSPIEEEEHDYEDVTGFIELPTKNKKRRSKNKNSKNKKQSNSNKQNRKNKDSKKSNRNSDKKKRQGPSNSNKNSK